MELALAIVLGLVAVLVLLLAFSVVRELYWDSRRRRAASCGQAPGDEEQPAPRKVVAVIGGGMSGLVCSKRMLDEGMTVVGFERADKLGGLWVFREGPEGKTYSSLRANVHKERLEMEGFPMPRSWPRYPSHWQLAEYLNAFAEHFGLVKAYKMQTEVVSCVCYGHGDEQHWIVKYRPVGEGADAEKTMRVDAVAMCVGQTCTPFVPTYPGQDAFQGRILHTSQYRGQAEFQGKRVLVVGAGAASGTDVAQDLSFGAKQVFLSVRRGVILLPRFLGGKPNGEWFERNIWAFVPFAWMLRLVALMTNMMTYESFGTGSADHHGIKGPPVVEMFRLKLDECKISDLTATDCCNLTQRVAMGAVRMRGAIESFTATGVRFADGTEEEVDAVIWATGFKRDTAGLACKVGRIGEEGAARLKLWRAVFHPSLPNFACCLQTHPYGSHWAVADMEARWISSVFAGRISLPATKQMEREAAEVAEHQSLDTCLDWKAIAAVSKQMGHPRPGIFRLLALLATKPVRTCRWLATSNVSRRISVDECAKPFDSECKFQTKL
mmetsp:Transcript_1980/g.5852  ORF Transcript_1980/g.5852 Transcript_1980/m.5852 type:complete len:551 (-) Transcript_1980:495-2147(-)